MYAYLKHLIEFKFVFKFVNSIIFGGHLLPCSILYAIKANQKMAPKIMSLEKLNTIKCIICNKDIKCQKMHRFNFKCKKMFKHRGNVLILWYITATFNIYIRV